MSRFALLYLIAVLSLVSSVLYAQLNVRTAGAKGDGKTDDSKAIRTALSKISGGTIKVLFPAGEYVLTQPIVTTTPGEHFVFERGAKIKLSDNVKGGILINHDGCSVENATIEGTSVSAASLYTGFGMMFSGVTGCEVKNCNFNKISGVQVFLARSGNKGCKDCRITNNVFKQPALSLDKGVDASCIMIGYSGSCYFHVNNTVSGNDINGAELLNHGIAIITHGNGSKVINNHVRNCLRYGIISYESRYEDSTLTTTSVLNNTVENIGAKEGTVNNMGMGAYFMRTHNGIIKGNTVWNTLRNPVLRITLTRLSGILTHSISV